MFALNITDIIQLYLKMHSTECNVISEKKHQLLHFQHF